MTTEDEARPSGLEPSAADPVVDGWAVRRNEAFKLLSEAELISKPEPAEAQVLALIGIGHALLALDDRLANQPPPIYVVTPSGDLAADQQFIDGLSDAMDKAFAAGKYGAASGKGDAT
jgi:hypothetical protein